VFLKMRELFILPFPPPQVMRLHMMAIDRATREANEQENEN